jgi:hypothetical protein
VARIYDVLAVAQNNPPISLGTIPLSPEDPVFQERRYWRLPVNIGAVLAALLSCIGIDDYESDEITCAQDIQILLQDKGLGVDSDSEELQVGVIMVIEELDQAQVITVVVERRGRAVVMLVRVVDLVVSPEGRKDGSEVLNPLPKRGRWAE